MIKKTITYRNFKGEEKTNDFYFHLSLAQLIEMQMVYEGGFNAHLEALSSGERYRGREIMKAINEVIDMSYGVRSDDGARFIKNEEYLERFKSGGAWDVLFEELCTDAVKAAEFFNGLVPEDLQQRAAEMARKQSEAGMGGFKKKASDIRGTGVASGIEILEHEIEEPVPGPTEQTELGMNEDEQYRLWKQQQENQ